MPKAAHGPATRKRHKRVLKRAKGFTGGRGRLFRTAKETVKRAMYFAYRDRKAKKRAMRGLWILRLNAACRDNGISYSKFIAGLKKAQVSLNRKQLSEIAATDDASFKKLVELVRK
ncbi:MAG: 50S ribosomal protein L20 [Candidatus Omnitrophica bacterium]|nr:50S ribosomal protein L20 [Candidatus Omnitrophota bacterium]